MALSIKTDEADRLARQLAQITGESLTDAVTNALRERLDREQARRRADADLPARLDQLAAKLRANYDTRPVTDAEWEAAGGER